MQGQLQLSNKKKLLKKDIYLQQKNKKLLMIWYQYISIIMEYQNITDVPENLQ